MLKKALALTICTLLIGICNASDEVPVTPANHDGKQRMVVMLDEKMYKLTPITKDPIDDFADLSPRNQYSSACELLTKTTPSEKILGARLMYRLIQDGNVTALEYLNLTCDVQEPSKYAMEELLDIIVRKSQ